jgi:hypothetical protein
VCRLLHGRSAASVVAADPRHIEAVFAIGEKLRLLFAPRFRTSLGSRRSTARHLVGMNEELCFVQCFHPGGEHGAGEQDPKQWNRHLNLSLVTACLESA